MYDSRMKPSPQTTGPVGTAEGGSEMYAALLQGEYGGDAALRASQQMLQILMDCMTNAVFWKDRQSRYLGCNRVFAAFAGVEPEAMVGLSDRDMPWADDPEFNADWFIDWDRVVVESGEPRFGIIERLRSAAGDVRWLETNKVPLRDLSGAVIGVLGTFEDVTERRAGRGQLAANPRRARRAGEAAHDAADAGQREPAARGRGSSSNPGGGTTATLVRRGTQRQRGCDVEHPGPRRGDGARARRRRATWCPTISTAIILVDPDGSAVHRSSTRGVRLWSGDRVAPRRIAVVARRHPSLG